MDIRHLHLCTALTDTCGWLDKHLTSGQHSAWWQNCQQWVLDGGGGRAEEE